MVCVLENKDMMATRTGDSVASARPPRSEARGLSPETQDNEPNASESAQSEPRKRPTCDMTTQMPRLKNAHFT